MLQELTGYLQKALQSRHTGSAMSPLLWINGIVTVPCLVISAFIQYPMNVAFFALAVGIILYSLSKYDTLIKIDPKLVQSEKLQFEMAKLDIVAKKGGAVIIDPVSIEFSAEPAYIGHSTKEEEEMEQ